jgi:tRNA A37 threonylcarbamoyladenosine dehydratase
MLLHSRQTLINPLFERLALITGVEGLEKLSRTKVLIFGAGGVGSWAAEALVRSGIGKLGIIDFDTICASNINRQAEATTLTIGLPKVDALKKRLLEINPECEITLWNELFCSENAACFDIKNADYVIDAIDTLNHKLDLIEIVYKEGVTLFSSMGMALRINPAQIKTASVWDTHGCSLARLVRQGLRKRGFCGDFTVVYSGEKPFRAKTPVELQHSGNSGNLSSSVFEAGKRINGSIVTVTASAGFMLASLIIQNTVNPKK